MKYFQLRHNRREYAVPISFLSDYSLQGLINSVSETL
jgi:hypothetical protein